MIEQLENCVLRFLIAPSAAHIITTVLPDLNMFSRQISIAFVVLVVLYLLTHLYLFFKIRDQDDTDCNVEYIVSY